MFGHKSSNQIPSYHGINRFLLSQLNKCVLVLSFAVALNHLPIHHKASPSSGSVSSNTTQADSVLPSQTPEAVAVSSGLSASWVKLNADSGIRSAPDINKPVLLQAFTGELYPVLSQSGGWTEVRLSDKQQGWVESNKTAAFQQSATSAQVLQLKTDSSLYWGPGESFGKALGQKAGDTLLPVKISGQWIQLAEEQDGHPLWVNADQAEWISGEPPAMETWSRDSVRTLSASDKRLPLKGKTVVVDPGHGGKDTGAIALIQPIYEKDVNLAVARVLEEKLRAAGANVVMTRTDDQFISLEQRAQISNDNQAAAFISIHQNMYEKDPTVSGTITFYDSPVSKNLAQDIQNDVTRELNSRREDEKIEKEQLYVLKHNSRPAVLIEGCFLSNPKELSASLLPAFQEKLAQGIYEGIAAYLSGSN